MLFITMETVLDEEKVENAELNEQIQGLKELIVAKKVTEWMK